MGKKINTENDTQNHETPCKRMDESIASNTDFTLSKDIVDGIILTDLTLKDWRCGKPIGKGSFGEIFLASDDITQKVTTENAKYVVKIEPHSNGPLFVEIHCLLNTAKRTNESAIPPGIPEYIASGSHYFNGERYRFLILHRYKCDLNSLIKNKRVDPKNLLIIAEQIVDILEHLHDKGYVHSDIKAENLMIGDDKTNFVECTSEESEDSRRDLQQLPNNGPGRKRKSMSPVKIPSSSTLNKSEQSSNANKKDKQKRSRNIEFSGTNPVRSCRVNTGSSSGATSSSSLSAKSSSSNHTKTYQDMVKSHYLRPLKNIVYTIDSDDEDQQQQHQKRRKLNDAPFYYTITSANVTENYKSFDIQLSKNSLNLNAFTSHHQESQHEHHHHQKQQQPSSSNTKLKFEERIFLIDFGLASKFIESSGQHRPFCMDQRRAHDGTLEFTSRDAHMGAHARRSDLECLGYNLVYWSQGFLPWKDDKLQNQPEQVQRMKEYFMSDVREMMKLIYGNLYPSYLSDFLYYIGQLTYDERPDYDYCRKIFRSEFKRLGFNPKKQMKLNMAEISRDSIEISKKDEDEITNKINNIKSLMKIGNILTCGGNKENSMLGKSVSPKNLRSKRRDASKRRSKGSSNGGNSTSTPILTRKRDLTKKFSWSEILNTDPDQIARERAEKEFERSEQLSETVIRYSGNPTYAILEIENKIRNSVNGPSQQQNGENFSESDVYFIKGYTKPMLDIIRKRQSHLLREFGINRDSINADNETSNVEKNKKAVETNYDDDDEEEDEEEEEDEDEGEEEEEDEEEEETQEIEETVQEAAVNEQEDNESEAGDEEEEEEEEEDDENDSGNDDNDENGSNAESEVKLPPKKGRGRPKINKQKIESEENDSDFINDEDELTLGAEDDSADEEEEGNEDEVEEEEEEEENPADDNEDEDGGVEEEIVPNKEKESGTRRKKSKRNFYVDESDLENVPQLKSIYKKRRHFSRKSVISRDNLFDKHVFNKTPVDDDDDNDDEDDVDMNELPQMRRIKKRRKSGLRTVIKQTKRSAIYHDNLLHKQQQQRNSHGAKNNSKHLAANVNSSSTATRYEEDSDYTIDESSSCSSQSSISQSSSLSSANTGTGSDDTYGKRYSDRTMLKNRRNIRKNRHQQQKQQQQQHQSSNHNNNNKNRQRTIYSNLDHDDDDMDDDNSRDADYSPIKTRRTRKRSNRKSLSKRNHNNRGMLV
uniref:non-specific serine/threonine protein kinase n=1 Tax=Corethrella appendiculata TaxID=1370023 RepID=U5ENN5_9DIPT